MKKQIKKNKQTTIDDLALMVKKGFDGVNGEANKRFNQVDERFEKIDRKLNKIDERFDGMDERLVSLEKGQEEIKMKLDNVVYRTEFIELQRRIEVLEKTVGVKS